MNRYKRLQEMPEQDRLLEEAYLIEMSISRDKAVERCMSLGKQFIKHFDKIYNENDEGTIKHHAMEMQEWLDTVLYITLKPKGKYIRMTDIHDWFIDGGGDPERFFTGPDIDVEVEVYGKFYLNTLLYGDVLQALETVGLYNPGGKI